MTDQEIIDAFHSILTLEQVRKQSRVRHNTVVTLWKTTFGEAAFAERKRLRYRISKLGALNPMSGKIKSLHPNWILGDRVSDSRGRPRIKAPPWFTGNTDPQGYVHEHVVVYCESRSITEIPAGMVVHHLDMNKTNNDPRNLIVLSNADHMILHAWVNRAIVQRLSRLE